MSRTEFLVTAPTRGAGRTPVVSPVVTDLRGGAYGHYHHLAQVGSAAETAAWDGIVVPFDVGGEDSLVAAAGLLRQSRWLRVVAEFHPAATTPVYAAKVTASIQRFFSDRFDWRIRVDLGDAARQLGDFVEGRDRYERADEFLNIAHGVWRTADYSDEGRFFQVLAGGFQHPLNGRRFPRVYLSGTSTEALELSARHADVHVFGVDDDVDASIAALRSASGGRPLEYAVELSVLARDDDAEAEREARRRPGADLVGSYETVATRLREYVESGVSTFVLSASPPVDETYRIGEHLLPLFKEEFTGVH